MTNPTKPAERRRDSRAASRRMVLLEGGALLLAAPFLIIPEAVPGATFIALLILGGVWIFSLLSTPQPATPFDVTLLLWTIALVIGILATADPVETLPKATNLILGLGVWRFLVLAIRARQHVEIAVVTFIFLCIGLSLIGIAGSEEVPKIRFLGEINPFRSRSLPLLGDVLIHPNQIAGLVCLYLPLLISLTFAPFSGNKSRLRRLALVGTTLLTVMILILTQSRGGWIGAAAGLFALLCLWALILPRSGSRRALRLAVAACVLIGLLALARVGPERLQNLWTDPPRETAVGTLTTLNYRKELWPWAITAVQDFPLTGVGLGAFRQVAFRLYPLSLAPDRDIGHAHNIFLQTALDIGLPGLVVYLSILFVAGATGWQVARRNKVYRPVSLGLLAGLVAVHVFGLADALALGSKPAIVFWFALGLLAAMNRVLAPQVVGTDAPETAELGRVAVPLQPHAAAHPE